MTDRTNAVPSRPKNKGIFASIVLISVLAFLSFSFISQEASLFQLKSKYYADTSMYEHVVKSLFPDVSPEIGDVTLEMRRGVEGLYYIRDDDDAIATTDDDAMMNVDDFEAAFEEAFRESELESEDENVTSEDIWSPKLVSPEHIRQILSTEMSQSAELLPSPACHPHFNLALPDGQFNNITKFKRIYLYHARKAGGSSMSQYFSHVAKTYGLDYYAREWGSMEEPGFGDKDTFYVAHVREPVDRAISHFKYQGRWHCKNLTGGVKHGFEPTEENANKLETWAETGGHRPYECKQRNGEQRFWLGNCAVNCYTQWFSGLSCPDWNIPVNIQYAIAKRRVMRYNLIVVVEKLRDPKYVDAIEKMFGVEGITKRSVPFCERSSHKANANNPLVIKNRTLERLTKLNSLDVNFYNELGGCLNGDTSYNFPKWDPSRFELNSWNWTEATLRRKAAKQNKRKGT